MYKNITVYYYNITRIIRIRVIKGKEKMSEVIAEKSVPVAVRSKVVTE